MAGGGPNAPRPCAPAVARGNTHAGTRARTRRAVLGWRSPGGLGTRVGRQGTSGLRAPGAGPGRTGPRAGELCSGRVMLCGAAWRLRLPSDLGAAAVRVERFVFAAAPLTAAITLAPHA